MFSEFLAQKMGMAKYKILEDKTYYGEIPSLQGVWANAKSLEDCRTALKEVLEDWALLKIRAYEPVPGLRIKFDRRGVRKYA